MLNNAFPSLVLKVIINYNGVKVRNNKLKMSLFRKGSKETLIRFT